VETVRARRRSVQRAPSGRRELFPVKFNHEDRTRRKVLIPNLSPAFSLLAVEFFKSHGMQAECLPIADARAIQLGKQYVHNDICFPAQVNIGEALLWMEQHPEVKPCEVTIGLAKNCESCRAVQYAVLARKALDEAGYPEVSIVTTGEDTKGMHPGFRANTNFRLHMLWGIAIMDCVETMYRASRPYELRRGETQEVYDHWMDALMREIAWTPKRHIAYPRRALRMLDECIEAFNAIEVDRAIRKPRVCLLGEILMNYHPGANGYIEDYLVEHGMEVVLPGMMDFFRVDELVRQEKVKRGFIQNPFTNWIFGGITAKLYSYVAGTVGRKARNYKLYEHHADCYELVPLIADIIDPSYNSGEGWLIPGEILYNASKGVNSFIIVQPFACLPNHITGRGHTKVVKARYPHIQVLSLDYDPDTSTANIENRLQMLIINARELEAKTGARKACCQEV